MGLPWGDTLNMAVFDIWADYGHFRRGATSTSPLTYPIPTGTAIAGIVSAILGIERNRYYHFFRKNNSAIAIQILNSIQRITFNQNLIDTKTGYFLWDNRGQRTQIPYEFLKNPKFRIFVWLEDQEKMSKLCSMVRERKSVFTLYMGISEHIAQFAPYKEGCLNAVKMRAEGEIEIHSVIPHGYRISLDPSVREYVYGYAKVPRVMNSNRVVEEYMELYFEENGRPMKILGGEYYSVGGEINIVPF